MDRTKERVAAEIRRRVERYGLRVVCLACGARGRHRPQIDGRLRKRVCPRCRWGTLRSVAWAKSHAAAFTVAARQERDMAGALQRWES